MSNTSELNKGYEDWLKWQCRPFVLVSRSLAAIHTDSEEDERLGLRVYTPDRKLFLMVCADLERALSIQPARYTCRLHRGSFRVDWLPRVSGGWVSEVRATSITVGEFAAIYAAIASQPGFPIKPYVYRDEFSNVYFM